MDMPAALMNPAIAAGGIMGGPPGAAAGSGGGTRQRSHCYPSREPIQAARININHRVVADVPVQAQIAAGKHAWIAGDEATHTTIIPSRTGVL